MKRRYGLVAVFDDPDFEMGELPKKFWLKSSVLSEWDNREATRRYLGYDTWHYEVIDLVTGENLTPSV